MYYCADTGSGYTLSLTRDAWIPVVYGVDNDTIHLNESGLIAVKSLPIASVVGLEDRLSAVEAKLVGGGGTVDVATKDTLGVVKGSDEVEVAEDGTMYIGEVDPGKISGLEDSLEKLNQALAWNEM